MDLLLSNTLAWNGLKVCSLKWNFESLVNSYYWKCDDVRLFFWLRNKLNCTVKWLFDMQLILNSHSHYLLWHSKNDLESVVAQDKFIIKYYFSYNDLFQILSTLKKYCLFWVHLTIVDLKAYIYIYNVKNIFIVPHMIVIQIDIPYNTK